LSWHYLFWRATLLVLIAIDALSAWDIDISFVPIVKDPDD
jgi:hypothetical protein